MLDLVEHEDGFVARGNHAVAPGGVGVGREQTVDGRTARAEVTREAILDAAERLFAEHGLDNVSHRQISAAAGQGNNAAVGYHFGQTTDLVRALVARHSGPVERIRQRLLDEVEGSRDLRDWAGCMVRPTAEHLDDLGNPTWWARVSAQLATDPRHRAVIVDEAMAAPALQRLVAGFHACVPDLPEEVRAERTGMARLLTVHVFAEREAALAAGLPTPRASWAETADGVGDALVGLWRAPVTTRG